MKLKKLMTIGLAAMMAFSLVACGNANDTNVSTEDAGTEESGTDELETEESSKNVTIIFATNVVGEKAEALEAACNDFEEETGYIVDFQAPGSSYEELMKTKMSANEMPDVFTTHGWSVARYSEYLMPINDLEWAENIDEQLKSVITDKDGNMYVLPIDKDIAGIICNMDVLEEADVDPDSLKTWDDFAAACEKIKAIEKNPVHIGGKDNWTIGQFFDWAAPSYYVTNPNGNRADELKSGTFDTDTWEEVAGMLASWVTSGYLNEDSLTADYDSDIQSLAEGKTAFCFYGNSSSVDALNVNPDAEIGMIPIPAASADDNPSLIAGEDIAVGVWKDSPMQEEAVELLNYLAREEVAKKIAEAAGSKSGLTNVNAEIGEIGKYIEKYADVEAFPYFDREYLPSGMWDVMCATGADILAEKDGAVVYAGKIMQQNFDDKFLE